MSKRAKAFHPLGYYVAIDSGELCALLDMNRVDCAFCGLNELLHVAPEVVACVPYRNLLSLLARKSLSTHSNKIPTRFRPRSIQSEF